MNITYVSTLCSEKINNVIKEKYNVTLLQSIQKYHRLICEGLAENNVFIKTISSIPIPTNKKHSFIKFNNEKTNGVNYRYLPVLNIKIIKQIMLFFETLVYVIIDIINNKNNVFICDILNVSTTIATLFICKFFKKKCVAIVTDRPVDLFKKNNIIVKLQDKFDSYIFLTEYMNQDINKNNKPYVIIEGIVDDLKNNNSKIKKYKKKVCLYAGGLYEKYGLKKLIDAFKQINIKDAELHIYGYGDLEEYIKNLNNNKIKYFGVALNNKIMEEERKATLLINPRFSNAEYTKYSFPSKNIEYLSSGTAVLTTKLKGIPNEYYKYVYTIDNETVDDIKCTLENILSKSIDEINKKGMLGQKFVIENKNKKVQGKKIKEMILK